MKQRINPHLVFVLGGARSGKSRFAEARIVTAPAPWTYLATAQAFDEEMRARIEAHRSRRAQGWINEEAPNALGDAVRAAASEAPLLVDCQTLWLTNRLLAEADLATECADLADALAARQALTLVVSNEVGLGVVPDNALARRFRDEAGILHQAVAARAGEVHLIVAGLSIRAR